MTVNSLRKVRFVAAGEVRYGFVVTWKTTRQQPLLPSEVQIRDAVLPQTWIVDKGQVYDIDEREADLPQPRQGIWIAAYKAMGAHLLQHRYIEAEDFSPVTEDLADSTYAGQAENYFIVLGLTLESVEKYDEACMAYEQALKVAPESYDAHKGVGRCANGNHQAIHWEIERRFVPSEFW